MVKVSDTVNIPIDKGVSLDDFLLGTDADRNNKTKNYKIKSLLDLFKLEFENPVGNFISYTLSEELDYKINEGIMNVNNVIVQDLTNISFNKISNTGVDLTPVFEMIALKKEYLKITLTRSSLDPFINIFNIKNINPVQIEGDTVGFSIGVELFEGISIGDLIIGNDYSVDFKIVPTETAIEDLPVYDSIEEARSALGDNKIFRYSKNNIDGVPSPKAGITAKT